MKTNLSNAILKTIAYFDVFDYPMTAIEVYKWLYQPDDEYSLDQVRDVLESEELSAVQAKHGFYFLNGREDIITTRLLRYQIAEKKFKIARRTMKVLRHLAFVEMVAICNNVGYNNGSAESDIDFFIIARSGRLWWTRLLVTTATTLLGVRRHGIKVVDRVCLSFYTSDSHLNLSDIALKPSDPYLVYWFATLAPIYNPYGVYEELLRSNSWLKDYVPNFYTTELTTRRKVVDTSFAAFSKSIDKKVLQGSLGSWVEKVAKALEISRMKRYLGSALTEPDSNVVVKDDMLKLHKTDRRELFKQKWNERLTRLGLI